jgi:hypothetical protein
VEVLVGKCCDIPDAKSCFCDQFPISNGAQFSIVSRPTLSRRWVSCILKRVPTCSISQGVARTVHVRVPEGTRQWYSTADTVFHLSGSVLYSRDSLTECEYLVHVPAVLFTDSLSTSQLGPPLIFDRRLSANHELGQNSLLSRVRTSLIS